MLNKCHIIRYILSFYLEFESYVLTLNTGSHYMLRKAPVYKHGVYINRFSVRSYFNSPHISIGDIVTVLLSDNSNTVQGQ